MKIWLDGKLVEKEQAAIGVYDHGLLYGDGVFEGIRVYGGRIFKCQRHLQRLFDGARAIRLDMPYDAAALTEAMKAAVAANEIGDGYIRLVVTRGNGALGLHPFTCERSRVFIIADKIQLYPVEMYETGLRVIIASTVRNNPNALSPRIKSLNYLNNIMARIEAIDAGVGEAIMLNASGLVAEATGDNVFIVRRGEVMTPPLNAGVLEGVTRDLVMDLGRQAGLPVLEADISRYDLYTCDECFLTGTAAEVVPVTSVDGRLVGDGKPGPITRQLMTAFKKKVREKA
jgi:branched-chain amino acid aminotransferase